MAKASNQEGPPTRKSLGKCQTRQTKQEGQTKGPNQPGQPSQPTFSPTHGKENQKVNFLVFPKNNFK